jgi:MarR family transcriptional regulator, negative regulator of the multidrug operon emrRAB
MLYLRDLPKYEAIQQRAARYPEIDPGAVVSYLVLLRVAQDVRSVTESFLAGHDMSLGRFSVLMLLNRDPDQPVSPSELAAKSGVTRATMTGLLDGLERERLVHREPDREDRRMLLVELTAKGRKLLDGILPDYYKLLANIMGQASEQEKKQLIELLNKVGSGLAAFAP